MAASLSPTDNPRSPFWKAGPYKCGVWGDPLVFPNPRGAVEWNKTNVQASKG